MATAAAAGASLLPRRHPPSPLQRVLLSLRTSLPPGNSPGLQGQKLRRTSFGIASLHPLLAPSASMLILIVSLTPLAALLDKTGVRLSPWPGCLLKLTMAVAFLALGICSPKVLRPSMQNEELFSKLMAHRISN